MKHLIDLQTGDILMSGIPGRFTRPSGETFWGGYQNMTNLHYVDGWRDEEKPDIITGLQQLGAPYYDVNSDIVTYEIVTLNLNIEEEKEKKITQAKARANTLLSKTDWYVIRKTERDVEIPTEITAEREAIVTRCDAMEIEITALETIGEVMNYNIDFTSHDYIQS